MKVIKSTQRYEVIQPWNVNWQDDLGMDTCTFPAEKFWPGDILTITASNFVHVLLGKRPELKRL